MAHIFLTDGEGTWIGPYLPVDIAGVRRGTRQLAEVHEAAQVYGVSADTEAQAKAVFAKDKEAGKI